MNCYQTLAANIKTLRRAYGYSQHEFSYKLGVDKSMVGFWEKERYVPTTKQLVALKKFSGISIDDLVRKIIKF